MEFINFQSIIADPMVEDSTRTSEQILNEKQTRENNFGQGLLMANRIFDNNPMILAYYWHIWCLREHRYVAPYQSEQMTRRLVKQMSLPTEDQRSLLQQHLQRFSVFLRNHQLHGTANPASAITKATLENPMIEFSNNICDVVDDNDRWLFVAVNILHELVHCFEPVTVDLAKDNILFCLLVNGHHLQDAVTMTFEQGEIFEIMMFGGLLGGLMTIL